MKTKPTSQQLVDMLEDKLDITICADVVHGLDLEYKELQEENKKLKMQLYSDDQIRVKCPNCGGKIIVNECRIVSDLKDRLNKAIEFMNKWGIQPDYDMSVEMREYEEFQKLLEILKGDDK